MLAPSARLPVPVQLLTTNHSLLAPRPPQPHPRPACRAPASNTAQYAHHPPPLFHSPRTTPTTRTWPSVLEVGDRCNGAAGLGAGLAVEGTYKHIERCRRNLRLPCYSMFVDSCCCWCDVWYRTRRKNRKTDGNAACGSSRQDGCIARCLCARQLPIIRRFPLSVGNEKCRALRSASYRDSTICRTCDDWCWTYRHGVSRCGR